MLLVKFWWFQLELPLNLIKILIATDGSVYSNVTAFEAIGTAKRFNRKLIVVSVAKRQSNVSYAEDSVKNDKRSRRKKKV